ncbi:hypothetical protein C8R46DRAFT_1355982 [Mycena filopes]|nr:hypothetical protein C8R46DRAFT_1355982 [Mycena filopes]
MHLTPEAMARAEEAERQPLPPHEAKEWVSTREKEDGQYLAEITGTDLADALRILRAHDGNMEKAADSIFNGATTVVIPVDDETPGRTREELESIANIKEDFGHLFPSPPNHGASGQVIDLTGNDSPPLDTRFRATTRSPDPAWQMVRSTQPTEDEQLNEVMQASLHDFTAQEVDAVPAEDVVQREPGRPAALHADLPGKAYAALIIQALFAVPQVRQRCSQLHLNLVDGDVPKPGHGHEWAMWSLIEMFTALNHGIVTVFTDVDLFTAWEAAPLTPDVSVGELSKRFLSDLAAGIQSDLDNQGVEEPGVHKLFHFKHCSVYSPVAGPPRATSELDIEHVVTLDINPEAPPNELLARLSETLNTYHPDGSSAHRLIIEPSEVVTFHISVSTPSSTTGGPSPEPFVFPKSIYMDQFLGANLDLANETRATQRDLQKELGELAAERRSITRFEDCDVFEDLRGGIEYYENVAQADTQERLAQIKTTTTKLKNILRKFEADVAEIDTKMTTLQAELDIVFDDPDLQANPYDLRAVLVHTGLPGRKHIYSYVHDAVEGVWWKTVDYTVTEVSEDTVLSDSAGLHLGAGPYMLIYSRRQSDDELRAPVNWPPAFVNKVLENNEFFLRQSAAEAAAAAATQTQTQTQVRADDDMMDTS